MSARAPAVRPGLRAALLRLLAALLLVVCSAGARADTPIALYKNFRGQVNFTGTEATLRVFGNYLPCYVWSSGTSVYAYLGGIPSGATVLSAQLYWTGSGSTPDYTVSFDGVSTTAATGRRHTSATLGGGYNYFSGAADVTSQVAAKGNGYYSFSGLTVDSGDPWCSTQGVLGGFALLVVYSHPNEAFRLLNVYEGFQYFRNNGFTLTLDNFAIPDPLPAGSTGRVGHITWEGDSSLSQGGEDLLFNGYEMTDSMNPSGNQFNSASNVTGDYYSYGIDFDAYTVAAPVIKPGQTSATTTYRTGQDLVLLSTEVAALPYIPVDDLSLAMTRGGALQVGTPVTYTLVVTNNGPDTEGGPVTVVDTLPSGMKLVSASGSGWTCASAAGSAGQTVVTCSQKGPVLSKASMPALVITATPTAAGSLTNSATVSGVTKDTNAANNSASDTASSAAPSAAFAFTTMICKSGDVIGSSACPQFIGPVTAAASASIYITPVGSGAGGQVVAPMSATVDTRVSVNLGLACAPASSVSASYAGKTFACGAAAQAVALLVKANQTYALLDTATAPAVAPFVYRDVGKLTLTLAYNGNTAMLPFYSRPQGIVFFNVLRTDGVADLHAPNTTPADVAFAKAGENFLVQLAATMADGGYAPSFGREGQALPVALTVSSGFGSAAPLVIVDNFTTSGSDAASGAGLLVGTLQWYEAGLLTLGGTVSDYLGTTPAYDLGARIVGRFYPDHFSTDFTAPFDCLAAMACTARVDDPANAVYGVGGAAYSGQPVNVSVKAFGLKRNGVDTVLTQYQPPAGVKVNLNAFASANGATASTPGSFPQVALTPGAQTGSDGRVSYVMTGTVAYSLGTPYDPAKPAPVSPATWSAPQAVYLRATVQDQKMVAGQAKAQAFTITSQVAPAPASPLPPQQEDGIQLVAGRLFVGNVFGSELTRVPLPVSAQYWNGKAWQTNTNDGDSVVGTSLKFGACTRAFVGCDPKKLLAIVGVSAAPTGGGAGVQVAKGVARLMLQAPARGQTGSIDLSLVSDPAVSTMAASWLPSTTGRANFGLFQSPLIYLREVY